MKSTYRTLQFIKILALICAGIVFCPQSMAVADKDNAGRWNTPSGFNGPDKEVPGFLINLGPTGARAVVTDKTFLVRHIFATSPAVGRLKLGDEITGVFGKPFATQHFAGIWGGYHGYEGPMMDFGEAIEKAESKDGKLVLDVIRDGKPIEVKIDLEVLGAFSPTFPMNCKKSETIRTRALAYLANYTYLDPGSCHQRAIVALALLTSDEPKQKDLGKKMVLEWSNEAPNAGTWSWILSYQLITLCEYHLMTRDATVLPAIQNLVTFLNKAQYTGVMNMYNNAPSFVGKFSKEAIEANCKIIDGGFSHAPFYPEAYLPPPGKVLDDGPNHYGPMVYPTNIAVIAWQLAGRCGATVNQDNIKRAVDYIHRGTNAVGFVHYGMQWFIGPDKPAVDLVKEFQAEQNYVCEFVGRTGSALIAHLLSPEFEDTPAYIAKYSKFIGKCFKGLPDGHGDANLDIFWTILGAGSAAEDSSLRELLDYHKYFFNMMRSFDGAFIIQPNRDGGTDGSYNMSPRLHPTATMVLAYGLNNPKLYLQGVQIRIPGIRPRELKGKLDLAYRAIVAKSYADSIKLIKSVRGTKTISADDTKVCDALSGYLDAQFEKNISSLSALEKKGDFFAMKDAVTKTRAIFGQIDGCGEKLKHFDDGLKSTEWKAAITVGTHYQQSLATLKRRRSQTTLRELEEFANKNADSLYGKRAAEVVKGYRDNGIIAEPIE